MSIEKENPRSTRDLALQIRHTKSAVATSPEQAGTISEDRYKTYTEAYKNQKRSERRTEASHDVADTLRSSLSKDMYGEDTSIVAGHDQIREHGVKTNDPQAEEYFNAQDRADVQGEDSIMSDVVTKAALQSGSEAYQLSKDVTQEAAIEDANKAGHDIHFGGQVYPAQTQEQLKESQSQ